MNAEIRYYLAIFVRRLPLFLLVSLPVMAFAAALAVLLPPSYVASGALLVESPQVPGELAQSTVRIGAVEQVQILQRRVLTRSALLEVARKYDVYEDLDLLTPDQIVTRMRQDSGISQTRGQGRRGDDGAMVVSVRFEARNPAIAANVANEFITRMLDENARTRREIAGENLAFFEQEVERLETELDLRNQALLEFQNANADALPDSLDFRMTQQSRIEERLDAISRTILEKEEQRQTLVEALDDPLRLAELGDAPRTPAEQQLATLRNQLTTARSVYAPTSPRVTTLQARVDALENEIAGGGAEAGGEGSDQFMTRRLRVQEVIAGLDSDIEFLRIEQTELQGELERLEATIRATPGNAIALQGLEREYRNTERQHARAVDALARAVTGERIETSSRGQRITVLEQATPPNAPTSPDRTFIAAAGVAGGLATGFGLVLLMELLNRSIRRPVDLTNALGIVPLVTVPYITTPWERTRRRLVLVSLLVLIVVAIPAGLWYVHYQVMPLDLLLDRVVSDLMP